MRFKRQLFYFPFRSIDFRIVGFHPRRFCFVFSRSVIFCFTFVKWFLPRLMFCEIYLSPDIIFYITFLCNPFRWNKRTYIFRAVVSKTYVPGEKADIRILCELENYITCCATVWDFVRQTFMTDQMGWGSSFIYNAVQTATDPCVVAM